MESEFLINKHKTAPMSAWNTGELALKQQQTFSVVDKTRALNDAVRRYQENQYLNYVRFLGELGTIGYCLDHNGVPGEVVTVEQKSKAEKTFAGATYGDYRRSLGISNNNDDFETGFRKNKPKIHSSWADEDKNATNPKGNDSKTQYKSNKINYMGSGWSDDEMSTTNNKRDRFGSNNSRYDGNRRGNRGRGDYRGRRFGNNSRSPRNNDSSNEKVSDGWSDDENEPKKAKIADVESKPLPSTATKEQDDDWDDEKIEKSGTDSSKPKPSPVKDDGDWD